MESLDDSAPLPPLDEEEAAAWQAPAWPLFDWDGAIRTVSQAGQLLELLQGVPRARWSERSRWSRTFLHYACQGNNAAATVLLLQEGLAVDVPDAEQWSPVHEATSRGQFAVLELLCAAGADLHARTASRKAPLEWAIIDDEPGCARCARVLLVNGVRLATVRKVFHEHIKPWMVALEHGRLSCRAVIVVFLGLKRRRRDVMMGDDRFLVREIAFAIWVTRAEVKWQKDYYHWQLGPSS